MRLQFLSLFQERYKYLSSADKKLVKEAIILFQEDPYNIALANHPLRKPMNGKRAFSVNDDLRIIFREKWNYSDVVIIDIWNHQTVYKK
jgi:mRNA-degrading endonuclease RelE of RelBE toxin-antitoxin system